jgi:hypothetical protein
MQDGRNRRARPAVTNFDRFMTGLLSAAMAAIVLAGSLAAQSSPRAAAPAANLNQLMRGLFFPHSNVVFATQILNPEEIKRAQTPSASTDPLTGVFGSWEAVENSALVLTEVLQRAGCSPRETGLGGTGESTPGGWDVRLQSGAVQRPGQDDPGLGCVESSVLGLSQQVPPPGHREPVPLGGHSSSCASRETS